MLGAGDRLGWRAIELAPQIQGLRADTRLLRLMLAAPLLAGATAAAVLGAPSAVQITQPVSQVAEWAAVEHDYARLPLSFEPNKGQFDPAVDFSARGSGFTLSLGPTAATLQLAGRDNRGTVLRLGLDGASAAAEVAGAAELPGKTNYLIGDAPAKWQTGLQTFERVRYRDVYPGTDVVYFGNRGRLEYDFRLRPGADPSRIALYVEGARRLAIAPNGDLLIVTPAGTLRERAPLAYQTIAGKRIEVASSYSLMGDRVAFQLGPYERSRPLTIDPIVLVYSTLLGGGGADSGHGIAVDGAGAAYVTGVAAILSGDFPTTPGAFDTSNVSNSDQAFVTKLNPAGTALEYSTFIGGDSIDVGRAIAVDSGGSAYITGETWDAAPPTSDFPTSPGAFDTTHNGGPAGGGINSDVFVAKLNATGTALSYSTFLGGDHIDQGLGIALDGMGAAYVTGSTFDGTMDFPTTTGAYDTSQNGDFDAFFAKLNPAGGGSTDLAYSTLLGGSGWDEGAAIAVHSGEAYLTGYTKEHTTDFPTTTGAFDTTHNSVANNDAFFARVNPVGGGTTDLAYSTFLGGAGEDQGNGIAVDAAGNAYVTGETADVAPDPNYPTTLGAFDTTHGGPGYDGFVSKLNPAGAGTADLAYSTFLGGAIYDSGEAIALGAGGTAHVTGFTQSTNFPTTPGDVGTIHTSYNGGVFDAFVASLNSVGSMLSSSGFLGGAGRDVGGRAIAVDPMGASYVTGETDSDPFPTTAGAFDTTANGTSDVFVAKIVSDTTPPDSTITAGPAAGAEIGDDTPTFEFSSAEDGSSFQCRIDDSPFGPCSGPGQSHTPAGALATGPHSFEVIATDRAGNTDPTPATRDFTILAPIIVCCSPPDPDLPDTDPPETKITRAPGAVVGRHRARFEFSSDEPGSTFECKLDRRDYKPCGSPRRMRGLDDGRHGFRVRATDPSGNVDPTPARSRWKITD